MAEQAFKDDLRAKLRTAYFKGPDDLVDVSDGDGDNVHVVIVSRKFDGKRAKEKTDLIWSVLTQNMPPDYWNRISLLAATSPEDIKSF